ncbi:Six-hairpin glycosidase-like protein [Mucidula mucida]|nr:Six-hairpin glycosidase-like protein [Mucidula mucida]
MLLGSLFLSLTSNFSSIVAPYDASFDVFSVLNQTLRLPSHSWEFGAASIALLELYSPHLSEYSQSAFPLPPDIPDNTPALAAGRDWITFAPPPNSLSDGDGAVGDPASLGPVAYLLGLRHPAYLKHAREELHYVLTGAPRRANGAISHRVSVPELWADFMFMAPPFIAYYGSATRDAQLLRIAYEQCGLYREVLQSKGGGGVWMHIVGPENADAGLWSTGNAWAASGMARVLAATLHAPFLKKDRAAIRALTGWIKEILDAVMEASPDENGLVRNYVDDGSLWFGDTSGSALFAAVVYRVAVLRPKVFGGTYVKWADAMRRIIASHVDGDGIAGPAVNPLNWSDRNPIITGSPEAKELKIEYRLLVSLYRRLQSNIWDLRIRPTCISILNKTMNAGCVAVDTRQTAAPVNKAKTIMSTFKDYGVTVADVQSLMSTTLHRAILLAFCHGIYTYIFFVALHYTIESTQPNRKRLTLASIISFLWVANTVILSLSWQYVDLLFIAHGTSLEKEFNFDLAGGVPLSFAGDVLRVLSILVADLSCACIVLVYIVADISFAGGSRVNWTLVYYSMTVAKNISGIGASLKTYRGIIEILVESAAILLIAYAYEFYFTDNTVLTAYTYPANISYSITGIAPTLIIARVMAGHSRPDDSWTRPSLPHMRSNVFSATESLQFASAPKQLTSTNTGHGTVDIDLEAQPEVEEELRGDGDGASDSQKQPVVEIGDGKLDA